MKKFTLALLMSVGLLISHGTMAAGTAISSGADITSGDCALLAETVQLNLSNNIFGGYSCVEVDNEIKVATCHKGGHRDTNTYPCTGTGTPVSSCADDTDSYDITNDYRGYIASSAGGTVAPEALGGNCTQATVNGLGHFD